MSRDEEPTRLRIGEQSTEPIEASQQGQEAEHSHWSADPDRETRQEHKFKRRHD